MDHFWHFQLTFVHSKCKRSSLCSQCWNATFGAIFKHCYQFCFRLVGFNEENTYDTADYRTVYTLVTNSKQRGVGDLFKRALMACYLLKILEMTPFFYNGGSDPHNVKLFDKVAMGAVLLRHLQNLPCNAHEITELEMGSSTSSSNSSNTSRDATIHEIGAAAYSTLSLINHSCDPNVVRHYYSWVFSKLYIFDLWRLEKSFDF